MLTKSWLRTAGSGTFAGYSTVFIFFLVASIFRNHELALLFVVAGIIAGFLFRTNPSDILVLGIPFSFTLLEPVRANVSIAHFVLPIALVLALNLRVKIRRNPYWASSEEIGFVVWILVVAGLTLIASAISSTELDPGVIELGKLGVSVGFGVWGFWEVTTKDSLKSLDSLMKLWVMVGIAVGVLALGANLVARLLGIDSVFAYSGSRLMGTFENPNAFALYMMISAVISLVLSVRTHRRSLAFLALAFVVLAALSDSLSVQFGIAALSILITLMSFAHAEHRSSLLGFALGALVSLPVGLLYNSLIRTHVARMRASSENVQGVIEVSTELVPAKVEDFTGNVRWGLWEEGFTLWQENPWLGVGYGNFLRQSESGLLLHNSALRILVETGILGATISIVLLLILVLRASRCGLVSKILLSGLGSVLVFGIGNNVLHTPAFWILIGFVAASTAVECPGRTLPRLLGP